MVFECENVLKKARALSQLTQNASEGLEPKTIPN